MIQLIYLEKYDWLIKVFYITNHTNIDLILKELDDIDCHPEIFYEIAEILENGRKPDKELSDDDRDLLEDFMEFLNQKQK